jgi:hypothetical protein
MRLPKVKPEGLKKTKAWEYLIRFAFGGLVAAGAGLVAKFYGPVIGGFFLAFPAILPASLTLVRQHDGRKKAVEDAQGARLGSLALGAFGLVVAWTSGKWPPPVVLGIATLVWVIVGFALWLLDFGRVVPARHQTRDAK